MKKLLIVSVTVASVFMGCTTQAQIVVDQGIATFASTGSGSVNVDYFVNYNGAGLYTYLYEFTTPVAVSTFEVNASYVSSVLPSGPNEIPVLATADVAFGLNPVIAAAFVAAETTYQGLDLEQNSVTYYLFPEQTGNFAFGYTSVDGPAGGTGQIGDTTAGPWGDIGAGTLIPVPAPVPEAGTALAGLLMLVPLGIGTIRALRKERLA